MLSGRCGVCGEPVFADDLPQLRRGLKAHCKTARLHMRVQKPSQPRNALPGLVLPWVADVPLAIISQNKTTYSHWTVYSKDKARWQRPLALALKPLMDARFWWSRWTITRQYDRRGREMDDANVVGGAKPVVDWLKTLGVIWDDRPDNFKCTYRQQKGDVRKTVLTLEAFLYDRPTE